MIQPNWSDDRIEQLKSLWAEGLSASQIAFAMGGVTRNAVIGKVHRLGLAGRTCPRRVSRPRLPAAPRLAATLSLPTRVPVVEKEPLKLDDGAFATPRTIGNRMCRWPIGDPKTVDFHFCGHSPKANSPYCEAHDRKAHQPPAKHLAPAMEAV